MESEHPNPCDMPVLLHEGCKVRAGERSSSTTCNIHGSSITLTSFCLQAHFGKLRYRAPYAKAICTMLDVWRILPRPQGRHCHRAMWRIRQTQRVREQSRLLEVLYLVLMPCRTIQMDLMVKPGTLSPTILTLIRSAGV